MKACKHIMHIYAISGNQLKQHQSCCATTKRQPHVWQTHQCVTTTSMGRGWHINEGVQSPWLAMHQHGMISMSTHGWNDAKRTRFQTNLVHNVANTNNQNNAMCMMNDACAHSPHPQWGWFSLLWQAITLTPHSGHCKYIQLPAHTHMP
jgi:hypothetical protein